ncbi:hypothetical protein KAR91_04105 [Candidatus Pacearchaeota archaeon]|nr:hypothetical protein [Candidatus Pacearchaeota archaeon]
MAIRIRNINGTVIALCARKSDPKSGDIYLDDNVHHALSTKFGIDWVEEGLLTESLADERLVPLMKKEEIRS